MKKKKVKLTKEQKIVLEGLRAIYHQHWKMCKSAQTAALKVTGEKDDGMGGRADEWLWDDEPISKLEELLTYDKNRKKK